MRRKKKGLETETIVQKQPEKSEILVKAAGGLVFRTTKESGNPVILLIYRNGIWDLPKGKLEPGESIPFCAAREVMEETGLTLRPEIVSELGTTYHSYFRDEKMYQKETFWFVMKLREESPVFTPQLQEGITEIRWVPSTEALSMVGFDNLETVIKIFRENLENLQHLPERFQE